MELVVRAVYSSSSSPGIVVGSVMV